VKKGFNKSIPTAIDFSKKFAEMRNTSLSNKKSLFNCKSILTLFYGALQRLYKPGQVTLSLKNTCTND
jgi:hypothetical protein